MGPFGENMKKMNLLGQGLAVASASLSFTSLSVFAAPSTVVGVPANTSTASAVIEAAPRKALPLSIDATSMFYGPTVTSPGRGATTAFTRDEVWGLSVQNQIAAKYKISDKMAITPVFDFVYQLTDPNNGGADRRASLMYDSYVKLSRSGLAQANIAGNEITLDGDVRYFVPSSEYSREVKSLGAARLSLNPSVQFGRSPLSLSSVNHMRYWFQTKEANAAGGMLPRMQLYTGPQLNYRFSDAVTAWVLYEATVVIDTAGMPNTRIPGRSLTDIEPGVDIRLSDRVSLTPYLNWYTSQPIKTTSVNLTANLAVL